MITGVPLVALGIANTQLGGPPAVEAAAATLMALSGLGVARLFFVSVWSNWKKNPILPVPRVFAGLALSAGMLLALAYGWRFVWPMSWLDIPVMYTLHGTLNAAALTTGWLALRHS